MNPVFASGLLFPQKLSGGAYFQFLPAKYPEACFPDVPVTGTVQQRAEALAAQVAARFPNGKVHIIAHSMAGLDARYLLSHNLQSLANPGRVASLSTVATPHCGSPVADLLVGARPEPEDPRRFLLLPLHAYIESRGRTADEKTNDGLVSVASAKWPGELVEPPWPTDHVGEAGHSLNIGGKLKFDHVAAFDRVVQRIASAS